MRKLIYFIASTIDGFIAREDGAFDFFPMTGAHLPYIVDEYPETIPGHLHEMLGVRSGNTHFDSVIMGRRTYEVGTAVGIMNPYPHLRQYVVSRSMHANPDPAVALVASAIDAVQTLKAEAGRDIWLCGGGSLAATLYGEIDELILKVNPVVLGCGIPLFGGPAVPRSLELLDHRVFDGGVAIHRYRTVHQAMSP